MNDKECETQLRKEGSARILWLRQRGKLDWQEPKERSPRAYQEAKAYNIQQVEQTKDPVLKRLRDRLQSLYDARVRPVDIVGQAVTGFVRDWLESYPIEYQRIQNMRFLG
jgi:hypothetical protein